MEADRIYTVFTKDFGMLKLHARSIRYGKSKLAGHMPLFAHTRIAFVYGREIFRLIDAEEIKRPSFSNGTFVVAGRMSHLFSRLVRGQEPDRALWDLLLSSFLFLQQRGQANLSTKKDLSYFSLLFGVRLLWQLGYVDADVFAKEIFLTSWEEALQNELYRHELAPIFEQGIRVSQL